MTMIRRCFRCAHQRRTGCIWVETKWWEEGNLAMSGGRSFQRRRKSCVKPLRQGWAWHIIGNSNGRKHTTKKQKEKKTYLVIPWWDILIQRINRKSYKLQNKHIIKIHALVGSLVAASCQLGTPSLPPANCSSPLPLVATCRAQSSPQTPCCRRAPRCWESLVAVPPTTAAGHPAIRLVGHQAPALLPQHLGAQKQRQGNWPHLATSGSHPPWPSATHSPTPLSHRGPALIGTHQGLQHLHYHPLPAPLCQLPPCLAPPPGGQHTW